MQIVENKDVMVFRKDWVDDRVLYSIGLSKKNKDGSYTKGYIPVSFKKGVEFNNKTKIKIKNAWLDFYKRSDVTVPYIFVNDYELVEEKKEEKDPFKEFGDSIKTEFDVGQQIKIEDSDLPF